MHPPVAAHHALLLSLTLTLASHGLAQAPTYTQFGIGCPGSVGVPLLGADAGSLPGLGGTFRARLSEVPDTGLAIGILGLTTTSWMGVALPLDLALIDMPGCALFTDVRHTTGLGIVGGQATWNTTLPGGPGWLGRSFFQQVFVIDASVPGLGAVMSNANEGVIGIPNTGAPTAEIFFPPPTSLTDQNTIGVRGTSGDPDGVAEVRVDGVLATTSDGYANWQVRVPLAIGINTLTVETRDNLGLADSGAAVAQIESQALMLVPTWIAVDLVGNRALVTDPALRAVIALDLATGNRTSLSGDSIGVGPALHGPEGIALDGNRALVVDQGLQAILAVDLSTGDRSILSGASTGVGPTFFEPAGIAVTGSRALVLDLGRRAITAIDLSTGDRSTLSDLSTGLGPVFSSRLRGIALDGSRALIVDAGFQRILAVDLATGDRTTLSDAGTGMGSTFVFPAGIAHHGSQVLVVDRDLSGGGRVVAVDLTTGDRAAFSATSIGVGTPLLGPAGIALDGNRALVVNQDESALSGGRIVAVDLATGSRTIFSGDSTGTGPAFSLLRGIALDGNRALVTNQFSARILAVDLATGIRSVLSGAGTGMGPVLFRPLGIARDGSRALVLDEGLRAVLSVNLTTGERSLLSDAGTGLGPAFSSPLRIALDGSRALVTDAGRLLAVDLSTGNRTILSDSSTGTGPAFSAPQSIAVNGSRALVTDTGLQSIIAVDLATGNRTIFSGAGAGVGPEFRTPQGIALHGTRLLVIDSSLHAALEVDTLTGERVILSR